MPRGALAGALVAIMFAFMTADALAANECGPASSTEPVVCDPNNYSSSEGNIFYQLPDNTQANYEFRLSDGLTGDNGIAVTRESAQVTVGDQTDDYSRRWNKPGELWANHGAFWVDTGFDFAGDITIYSAADLTARNTPELNYQASTNARGISVRQIGKSGDINVYVTGGMIESDGYGVYTEIDSRYDGPNTDYTADAFRDEDYRGDILIDISGARIKATTGGTQNGSSGSGAAAFHRGNGDISIRATAESLDADNPDIETLGSRNANGLVAQLGERWHSTDSPGGNIDITVRNFHIQTRGAGTSYYNGPRGIRTDHFTAGSVKIDVSGSRIATEGYNASGIYSLYHSRELDNNSPHGVRKGGPTEIDVSSTRIETQGDFGSGIFAYHAAHTSPSNLGIDVRSGSAIATQGENARGIIAGHHGDGNIGIGVSDSTIMTVGSASHGIIGAHRGIGDLNISVADSRVETEGVNARGIYGFQLGTAADEFPGFPEGNVANDRGPWNVFGGLYQGTSGASVEDRDLNIEVRDTHIRTTGDGAHGIEAERGDEGAIRVYVAGGLIETAAADTHGVYLSGAGVDMDGDRQQTVTLNGAVKTKAESIVLKGGGQVVIGPRASIASESGIAVHATEATSTPGPKLRVDLNLDGRRPVSPVLGNNRIVNDGGETAIYLNGVLLQPGAAAPNGVWDLWMREGGDAVFQDFSAEDFTERYAPRAAVYEALPGWLSRLSDRARPGDRERRYASGSSVWGRISASRGFYEASTSRVGAEYDFDRYEAALGVNVPLFWGLAGGLGLRAVKGEAEVSAPTGGGAIDADGYGFLADLAWLGEGGFYGVARVSGTRYDLDLNSASRGLLARDADASSLSWGMEMGRRLALTEATKLVGRVWAGQSEVSLDALTDETGSRISDANADHTSAGAGVEVETNTLLGDSPLAVASFVGVEQVFDADTSVVVSGQKLRSEGPDTRVLFRLDAIWSLDAMTLEVGVSADGLGTKDREFSTSVGLRAEF